MQPAGSNIAGSTLAPAGRFVDAADFLRISWQVANGAELARTKKPRGAGRSCRLCGELLLGLIEYMLNRGVQVVGDPPSISDQAGQHASIFAVCRLSSDVVSSMDFDSL